MVGGKRDAVCAATERVKIYVEIFSADINGAIDIHTLGRRNRQVIVRSGGSNRRQRNGVAIRYGRLQCHRARAIERHQGHAGINVQRTTLCIDGRATGNLYIGTDQTDGSTGRDIAVDVH